MTSEQRKINLINWINNLEDEFLLQKMEELKENSSNKIPNDILSLLENSNNSSKSELIEHTSAKDLLNKEWRK